MKNTKILISIAIVLLLSQVGQSAWASYSPIPTTAGEPTISSSMNTYVVTGVNIDFSVIEELRNTGSLEVLQATSTYEIEGQTYTIGLGSSSLADISSATTETIADLSEIGSDLGQEGEILSVDTAGQSTYEMILGGINFDSIEVTNLDPGTLTKLQTYGLTTSSVSVGGSRDLYTPRHLRPQSVCGAWEPTFMNSKSDVHSVSGRYDRITFAWTSASLAALKCTGSTTFEPDFVTYNYDGKHYLGYNTLSWASNLPDAYLDTNIGDSQNELVYTLGTPSNSKLVSGLTYSNYIHTDTGNSSTDLAKIVWQRGHQIIGCPPLPVTWCIYADESQIILAWLITMPGSYS